MKACGKLRAIRLCDILECYKEVLQWQYQRINFQVQDRIRDARMSGSSRLQLCHVAQIAASIRLHTEFAVIADIITAEAL